MLERTKAQLTLKVIGGSHHGEEISVTGPKFFIGRDRDCQLRLQNDVISRHHCALVIDEGYVGVRDFNSKNGTFVDGNRVVGETELRSGSELVLGPVRFLVQREMARDGKEGSGAGSVRQAAARPPQTPQGREEEIDSWLDDTDPGKSDSNIMTSKSDLHRRSDVAHTVKVGKETGDEILTDETAEFNPETAPTADDRRLPDVKEPGKLPHRPEKQEEKTENTQAAVNKVLRKLREKKKKEQNR